MNVSAQPTASLDAFFESFYGHRPVTATFTGIHDHDHALPDFSPEAMKTARDEMSALRRKLADGGYGVLHSDELRRRDWEAIDGALADSVLEVRLAEDESGHFVRGNPSLAIGEALFSVVALAGSNDRSPVTARVEATVSRLRAFPDFLHGARRTLGEGDMPAAWRDRAIRECDGGVLLLADLAGWPVAAGAPVPLCRALQEAATHAAAAVEWFRAWLGARPDAPLARYAAGHGFLARLIRRGHWCDVSIDRLQHEARAALEREISHLRDALQGETWPEVAARLAGTHPDTGDILNVAQATWNECRQLSSGEVTWPDEALPYVPTPEWARRAAPFLYYLPYRSPAPYDGSIGRYDVLLPDGDAAAPEALARNWNHAAIKLNHIAHHGGLGHHVQNWHAARSPSRIGRVAAVDTASRIAMFCGGTMAEGWACYATEIMESLGFLTPDERISEQHTRVRLMTRAVVDLELHTGRMTFDDAVHFHVSATEATLSAAHAEVTKCSMFPGTAMMYWLGLRDLWRLRSAEEAARGTGFSAKSFHDELLSFGSIPVSLAARLMASSRPEARSQRPEAKA